MEQDRAPQSSPEPASEPRPLPFPINYEYSMQRERWQPPRRISALGWIARAVLALVLIPVILVPLYWIVPPVSTLMLWRWVTLQPVTREWKPIGEISPALVRMVIAGEDGRFCTHGGVDWQEVQNVIDDAEVRGFWRGASTIPMQVAKNLFLWPGQNVVRKALELPLAYYMSLMWSKTRMMEIYLNIAEWGPEGQFGVEAAARRAFNKSARDLSAEEAALLAGALPNPILRDPRKASAALRRAADQRLRTAGNNGPGAVSCVISRR